MPGTSKGAPTTACTVAATPMATANPTPCMVDPNADSCSLSFSSCLTIAGPSTNYPFSGQSFKAIDMTLVHICNLSSVSLIIA